MTVRERIARTAYKSFYDGYKGEPGVRVGVPSNPTILTAEAAWEKITPVQRDTFLHLADCVMAELSLIEDSL